MSESSELSEDAQDNDSADQLSLFSERLCMTPKKTNKPAKATKATKGTKATRRKTTTKTPATKPSTAPTTRRLKEQAPMEASAKNLKEPASARSASSATDKHAASQVEFSMELITPKQAATFLTRNHTNRALRRRVVERYARDILSGAWKLNGDTIRFNTDDQLLDGQHRLHAIVKAGQPAHCLIVRGLADEVMQTIDQGAKRSAADMLKLRHEANASTLASALRTICNLKTRNAKLDEGFTIDEMITTLDDYPSIRDWVVLCHYNRTNNRSALAAVATLAERKYTKKTVMTLLDKVVSGEGLRRTDPAFVLRETTAQWRLAALKGTRYTRTAWVALALACVSAHCKDQKMATPFIYRTKDPLQWI